MAQDKTDPTPAYPSFVRALVAVAAGAAGALLFFLAARGTWAAMLMSYFAPLPLMVATLGFGLPVGGAAVITGGLVAGLVSAPVVGLAVSVGLLLPAFLVCVAGLYAPDDPPDRRASRIVLAATIFAAASAIAVVASLIVAHGGAANARTAITSAVLPLVKSVLQESRMPAGITSEELARVIVGIAPAIVAASSLFMLVLNAYIAGRVALISGQLAKPWPPIADTLALPAIAAGIFAIACGLVFLGGVPGMVASIIAAALGCGFALEGLAVLHALTRRLALRMPLLIFVYALVLCLPPWPLLMLALVGFVDAAFHLRRRAAAASSDQS